MTQKGCIIVSVVALDEKKREIVEATIKVKNS